MEYLEAAAGYACAPDLHAAIDLIALEKRPPDAGFQNISQLLARVRHKGW